MNKAHNHKRRWAVTLLELLVVVLIIGILSTVATGVYTGEVRRARIAATQDLIRQLEIAITRYEVDLGQFPPSGSGSVFPPLDLAAGGLTNRRDGSGYLYAALVHSMSGNQFVPASDLWEGPYINLQASQLARTDETAFDAPGEIDILDVWGNPIRYVRSEDYDFSSPDFSGGTRLFNSTAPEGADPDLPAPNPFVSLGETYYNAKGVQIYSLGPDGVTLGTVGAGSAILNFRGAAEDDVNNFGY